MGKVSILNCISPLFPMIYPSSVYVSEFRVHSSSFMQKKISDNVVVGDILNPSKKGEKDI